MNSIRPPLRPLTHYVTDDPHLCITSGRVMVEMWWGRIFAKDIAVPDKWILADRYAYEREITKAVKEVTEAALTWELGIINEGVIW